MLRNLAKKIPFARTVHRNSFFLLYWKERVLRDARPKGFAQDREDLELEKLLGKVDFFVDVGAHDGISGSNTFYFAIRGARGICFEPIPDIYGQLRSLYLFNRRVICKNCGISDRTGESEIVALGFLSYIPETEDKVHSKLQEEWHTPRRDVRKVRLFTFEDATRGMVLPEVIDLLSVDVEGHELNVLKSIPFHSHTFRAIIVETHHLQGADQYTWKHRDLDEINALLGQHGYAPVFRSAINTIYLPRPV